MATPVPVVSMMYFFVVLPPKVTVMARPAFAARSVNWTGDVGACASAVTAITRRSAETKLPETPRREEGNRTDLTASSFYSAARGRLLLRLCRVGQNWLR